MADPRFQPPRDEYGTFVAHPQEGAWRRVVTIVLMVAAAGALALVAIDRLRPALERWVASDPAGGADRLIIVLVVLAFTADLPLVLGAVYFWQLGARTIEARRFPPEGTIVLRPTPVLIGEAALRRGRAAQLYAMGLLACSMALVAILVGLAFLATTGDFS